MGRFCTSASLRSRVDGNFQPAIPYPGDYWHAVRVQVLAAARAAGLPVNRTRVNSLADLRAAVDALKLGDPIVLQLERHSTLMYLAFTAE